MAQSSPWGRWRNWTTPRKIRSQMIAFYLFVANTLDLGKAVSLAALLVVPLSWACLLVVRRSFAKLGEPA